MFSMPPATATLCWPSQISCAAVTMAWAPEPQTRLTVMAGPGQRFANDDSAQLGGWHAFQGAVVGTNRSANRVAQNDITFGHGTLLIARGRRTASASKAAQRPLACRAHGTDPEGGGRRA